MCEIRRILPAVCAVTGEIACFARFFAWLEHRDARAGASPAGRPPGDEQVRYRAVQALEGEPSKVTRAGADTTRWHRSGSRR